MQEDIRRQLAAALASVSKHHAQRVADPSTDIEIYGAPFLKAYRIYRIKYFGAYHPELFYVGFATGRRTYLLTPNPENYVAMAHGDGLVIDSSDTAVDYVTVYVEVTRSMSSLSYLVRSVDEVLVRPNLNEEQEETKIAFVEKYRSLITPPTATAATSGYVVTAYVVHEQVLERHTFKVSSDGDINNEVSVLEQRLPLVYGA